jgi:hypothetical protein
MINFVNAIEHYVHKYAKFGGLTFYEFFVIKYSKIGILVIFYMEIKHKYGFGQSYCKYIVNRIL